MAPLLHFVSLISRTLPCRRFQGSPEEMYHTLITVLADLPPDTLVYCGHEYTVANLEFAATVGGCQNKARAWSNDSLAATSMVL